MSIIFSGCIFEHYVSFDRYLEFTNEVYSIKQFCLFDINVLHACRPLVCNSVIGTQFWLLK